MQASFPPNKKGGWKVHSQNGKETAWLDSDVSCEEVDDQRAENDLQTGKEPRRRHSAPAAQAAAKGKMSADDAGGDAGGEGAKKVSAGEEGEREEVLTEKDRAKWWKDTMRIVKELLGALRRAEIKECLEYELFK